ncbi:Succinate-semialdehyde dehydrogenase, mitochondrial [Verticillium nonalfalfae]|uniref:Succinate-semialdehyde dehydrogenase, mitochondrial n=1 Tax=Verticillium nonalfalfae TaxID=1051616 RepID=A0A3M9Y9M8_9PEZI|nr:Succinate-semialdehyde dehydrogenase, mitochondrial [Verticillium nonalfalfae]RNJ55770.1 Succinate-semialdehyde dehydrogenase, mitochondrial [Verticillium nonalfalfae]
MATSYNTTAHGELPFTLADKNLLQFSSYVHGEFVAAKKGKTFDVLDPGNGNAWASCPDNDEDDVEPAVQSSYAAFQSYSKYTPRQRAQLLLAWHQLIVAAREDLARIVVHETGKPMAEALGEIDYATTFSWWFVGEADRAHGSALTSAIPGRRAVVVKQPIGVAAALVPWNFPVALALRKAAAALAAGCTMVVKTSPETPLSAVSLAYLATRAGFPPGALNVLTTSLENTPAVAEALCLHPRVKKVSFTGSTHVGKLIAGLCARNLKKTTLELGGNCPFVVFDDAHVEQALGQLMALKWRHAGQACVTSNRVYVQSGIYDVFVAKLVEQTKALKVGHGMGDGVTMGALTTPRGLDKAEELYRDAVAKGAKTVLGTGQRMDSSGYFMAPTVLTDMTDDMAMSHEEIFAPILGVYRFESEDEVTQRANHTPLGLASYVFSKNVDRLWRMFENLEAGMIGLNTGNSSAAEAPFGGIKDSGYGKESGKDVAINEFLITKTGTMAIDGHY